MNKGLRAFTGDAVGFLNADDRFSHEGVLSQIVAALADAEISYGHLDFTDRTSDSRVVRRWRAERHRPGAFANGWMPAHPTFYVRRNVVDAVGGFDLDYNIAADYDFMLRAMELHGFRSRLVDDVLVEMSYGGKSTAGIAAYLKSNVEALRSRRRWLAAGAVDRAFIAKPLRKVGQFLSR
jgi:GT2 family glycosyltransferase